VFERTSCVEKRPDAKTSAHRKSENRNEKTLGDSVTGDLPLVRSDEWPSYRCLTAEGFIRENVNHQENDVDPLTGARAHRALKDRDWMQKISILKKKKGVPIHMLRSHLDQYFWKMWRKNKSNLFIAFCKDTRATYINNEK
jgi:hypothetical protein